MVPSAMTFDPFEYLVLAEAPVLSEAVSGQSFRRAFAHAPMHPGHWHA